MPFEYITHVKQVSPTAAADAQRILMKKNTPYGLLEEVVDKFGVSQTIEYLRLLVKERPTQSSDGSVNLAKMKLQDELLNASYTAIALETLNAQPRKTVLD